MNSCLLDTPVEIGQESHPGPSGHNLVSSKPVNYTDNLTM